MAREPTAQIDHNVGSSDDALREKPQTAQPDEQQLRSRTRPISNENTNNTPNIENGTSSRKSLELGDHSPTAPSQPRQTDAQVSEANEVKRTKVSMILFALAIICLPLLLLSLCLLAFVLFATERVRRFHETPQNPALPFQSPPTNAFYTDVSTGKLLLVSTWVSTCASWIMAPFMLLLSFYIAFEISRKNQKDLIRKDSSDILREIFKGEGVALWHWVTYVWRTRRDRESSRNPGDFIVHQAALSLMFALFLS